MSEGREIIRRLLLAAGGLAAVLLSIVGIGVYMDSSGPGTAGYATGFILMAAIGFIVWRWLVNWILLHKPTNRDLNRDF